MISTMGATNQISRAKLYWFKIKGKKDFVLRAKFRESIGNPALSTFNKWMNDPGKMKSEDLISLTRFLSGHFPNDHITPEQLCEKI